MTEAVASHATPIVFVVDDDVSVRESLELLIRRAGWQPEIFASADEFLFRPRVTAPSCLILDVGLPGIGPPVSFARSGTGSAGIRRRTRACSSSPRPCMPSIAKTHRPGRPEGGSSSGSKEGSHGA
jgi:hypothetical protein